MLQKFDERNRNLIVMQDLHVRADAASSGIATKALSDALHQLKVAQDQLIQREKIAALGHLIAGIAHEINTPLGAIRASITNISHALEHSLDYLPRLFQTLSPERQADFS